MAKVSKPKNNRGLCVLHCSTFCPAVSCLFPSLSRSLAFPGMRLQAVSWLYFPIWSKCLSVPAAHVKNSHPCLLTCSAEGSHDLQYSSLEIKRSGLGSMPQHGKLSRNVVHGERELRVLRRSSGGRQVEVGVGMPLGVSLPPCSMCDRLEPQALSHCCCRPGPSSSC